jgi:hypothetical protein
MLAPGPMARPVTCATMTVMKGIPSPHPSHEDRAAGLGGGGSSRFVLLPGAAEQLGTGARIRRYRLAALGERSRGSRPAGAPAGPAAARSFDHLSRQYD